MRDEEPDLIAAAIERGRAGAGPAMRRNFVADGWVMSANEFRAFWAATPMAAITTVSARFRPHTAPLEIGIDGDDLVVPTFANAIRLRDIRENPNVSIVCWKDSYEAVIVYGQATFADGGSGMVVVRVRPDRIYAIRPPAGHHSRC